jgi:hypothetical protein
LPSANSRAFGSKKKTDAEAKRKHKHLKMMTIIYKKSREVDKCKKPNTIFIRKHGVRSESKAGENVSA